MSWMNIIIIFITFLIIGGIANLGKNIHIFIKASLLSFILLISSFIALFLGCVIVLIVDSVIQLNNSLFTYGVIIILVSGIVEYLLINFLINKYFNDEAILIIVEYIIQWSLIYLTLYQFITQSVKEIKFDFQIGIHILDVTTLNLTILPVLLISWISITMIKIHQK
ncbi:SA1002 family membrane protein [Staphylococcus gallinarum]